MRIIYCLLLLNWVGLSGAHAQSGVTDSLTDLLSRNASGTPAYERLQLQIARSYQLAGAYATADSLTEILVRSSRNDTLIAGALATRALAAQRTSRMEEALDYADQAQALFEKIGTAQGLGEVINTRGNVYLLTGRFDEARTTYMAARAEFAALRDTSGLSMAEGNLGNVDYYAGALDDALQHYLASLAFAEAKEDLQGMSRMYNNLGAIYYTQAEIDRAEEYLLKGANAKRVLGDQYGLSVSLQSLGGIYVDREQYAEAIGHYRELLPLKIALQDNDGLKRTYFGLGVSYQGLYRRGAPADHLDSARLYLERSLSVLVLQPDSLYTTDVHTRLARLEYDAADYPSALARLDSAAQYAPTGWLNTVTATDYYDVQGAINRKLGNYAAAATAYETLADTRDSFYTNRQGDELAEVRTKYETAEKEKENAVLLVRNEAIARQNKAYLIGGSILFALLAGLAFLYAQLQRRRNIIAAQKTQLEALNATKDKFFGIIAHDIRSPITALDGVGEQMRYYRKKQDESKLDRLADRVDSTAKRLTALLDNLLSWALLQTGTIPYRPETVSVATVADETLALFAPLAAAKEIRLVNAVSSTSDVYADGDALRTILRNLLNNAVKFTPPGGEVRVSTATVGDKETITINDTGTGISTERLERLFALERSSQPGTAGERGSGLGLLLCKELVELNRGTIRAVSELGRGSAFAFSLPRSG